MNVIASICFIASIFHLGKGQTAIGDAKCSTLSDCVSCICNSLEGCELTRSVYKSCKKGPNTLNKVGYAACASNAKCTSLCIQNNLLAKTSKKCTGSTDPAQVSCAQFAQLHYSGGLVRKCTKQPAIQFGKTVNKCCRKLGCPTVKSCTECICAAVNGELGDNCELTPRMFRACRNGPVWIWMDLETCEDNPRCVQTCMDNILQSQSQLCANKDPSQVPCTELGRYFKAAPRGCPKKQQYTSFANLVDRCCSGKMVAD